jgi:hypothetical protein
MNRRALHGRRPVDPQFAAMSAHRFVIALMLSASAAASAGEPLRMNPFDDPFVQATAGRPCPTPRGPAYTDDEVRKLAHDRIERGTSCWLAGSCAEPNAYRYDKRIAAAAVDALRADAALASSSAIWVLAERRIVWLQGCVSDAALAARAEAIARAVPDVHLVLPMLIAPGETPRYPLAPAR